MPLRIKLSEWVVVFLNSKPPQFRRKAKRALSGLANWEGDIRPLRDELEGYYRLRIGRYRFLFSVSKEVEVIFAGPRSTAYETFEAMVASGDLTDPPM